MRLLKALFLIVCTIGVVVVIDTIYPKLDAVADATGEFLLLSARTCGFIIIGIIGAAIMLAMSKTRHERNRQRDGAYALREYHLVPFPMRVWNFLHGRPSPKVIYDPNLNPTHSAVIWQGLHTPDLTADQLAYALEQERANRARATITGDDVKALPWHRETKGASGVPNVATGRYLTGALDPKRQLTMTQEAPLQDDNELPQIESMLTVADAVKQSIDGSVILGSRNGEMAIWQTNEAAQIAVFGANGTGKTQSVAAMAVLCAVKWKWHVVILDPKRGADWRIFEPYVERHDSGPDEMLNQLTSFSYEVDRRRTLLTANNVGHYNDLPASVKPRRILLVVEELGDTRAQLAGENKGKALAKLDAELSSICRISRYTGINALFIDQRPESWPNSVKANLKGIVTFKLGLMQGNAVGFYNAHNLANVGEFAFEGRIYDAVHVYPVVHEYLSDLPQSNERGKIVLRNGQTLPPLLNDAQTRQITMRTPEVHVQTTTVRERVYEYISQNPTARQSEIVVALHLNPNQVHKYFHAYHKSQKEN